MLSFGHESSLNQKFCSLVAIICRAQFNERIGTNTDDERSCEQDRKLAMGSRLLQRAAVSTLFALRWREVRRRH